MLGGSHERVYSTVLPFLSTKESDPSDTNFPVAKRIPTEDVCFGSEVSIFKFAIRIWVLK